MNTLLVHRLTVSLPVFGVLLITIVAGNPAEAQFIQKPKLTPTPFILVQYRDLKSKIERNANYQDKVKSRLDAGQKRLKTLQSSEQELLEKLDQIGLSDASFNGVIRTLQTQRVELTIDLAGIQARSELLLKKQQEIKLETSKKDKPVIEKLQELLERQRQGYIALKRRVPRLVLVDATRDADAVRREVTARLWRGYAERANKAHQN